MEIFSIKAFFGSKFMRSIVPLFLTFLILMAAAFISVGDNNEEYTRLEYQYNDYIIMPETLVYKIKANDKDYVLYDVRDSTKYSEYHILGAKNFPWIKIRNGADLSFLPRNKKIILISSDGFYSLKTLELLINKGYTSVYSIEGGMDNWPYKKLLVK